MAQKVVVLGGGVAGLSAAHELVERGFDVEVYEALPSPGGKARSISVPGSGMLGPSGMRKDLPGEHGFRFFPRFYSHVTDTMKRIPFGADRTVFDNLVDTTRVQLARFDRPPIDLICRSPRGLDDLRVLLGDLDLIYQGELDVSHDEIAFFASRIWQILTSCRERRMDEYEKLGWWEFIGAAERSPGYQALLGHGITRSLVAAKADLASTKTIGDILVQLLFDIAEPGPSSDRVLNGPTNDVWISPWLEYLLARGVRYHLDARVTAITCAQGRIQDVTVCSGGASRKVASDYYVCALPVEDLVPLLTPSLIAADPSLANLRRLEQATAWMVGIQIFLTEDVDLAHGHTIYVDSPWALTSISQAQFWSGFDLSQY
ncbi:MAG: FAD-dependent oxidoreductase, partial [Burkholderiales bacterium]